MLKNLTGMRVMLQMIKFLEHYNNKKYGKNLQRMKFKE